MDVPERLIRGPRRLLDTHRIGNVAGNATHTRCKFVQALQRGCHRIGLYIGKHDFHSLCRKGSTERKPDPLAPPVTNAVLPVSSRMLPPVIS